MENGSHATDLRHRRRVHRPALRRQPAGRRARRRRPVHRAVPGARAGVRLLGVDVPGRGDASGREYATRIFTPEQEIPFAGHPTLGTAWALRSRGLLTGDEATQVCGAGRIGVRFDGEQVELTAVPRDLAGPVPPDVVRALLRALGLSLSDVAGESWVAGCGLSFVHVPVTEEALVRASATSSGFPPVADRLAGLGRVEDLLDAVNLYAVAGTAPHLDVHSRVFVPGAGVPEDPATGSAAAGLGLALVATGLLPEGGRYTIRQGSRWAALDAVRTRGGHRRVRDAVPRRRAGAAGGLRRDQASRPSPEGCGSGQLRPALDPPVQDPRQRAAGGRRRPDRGGAVVACRTGRPAPRRARRSAPPGARRWCGPSPSAAVARSGAFSRPGTRAPVTGPHCSDPGLYDGRGADPRDQPAAVVLAAHHHLDARAVLEVRAAAARHRRRPGTGRRRPRRARRRGCCPA